MKKRVSLVVSGIIFLSACGNTPSAPSSTAKAPTPESASNVDVAAKLNGLTSDKVQDLLSKVEDWKKNNPEASDDQTNSYFVALLNTTPIDSMKAQWSIGEWTGLGPYQGALCNAHPINCAKTKIYKDQSQDWANRHSGYSNGINGGKIDAARHTYWNALMTRGIDRQWAHNFSYAHEQDSPPYNNVGWNLRNMDLYNNDQGQNIGVAYPASQYADSQVESKVKDYMYYGKLRVADGRLKTAAQGGCQNMVLSNSPEAFTGWTCQ